MYYEVFQLHADLLKAMSHPKRLEIIHLLRDQELNVSEIQQMLDLPQANLSQHLMVLRDNKVVSSRREGKAIFYKISDNKFVKASDLIRQILIAQHKNDENSDEFTHKMSDLVPLSTDPVCGMRVSPKTAAFAKKHDNKDYYFCASGCADTFDKNPSKFI